MHRKAAGLALVAAALAMSAAVGARAAEPPAPLCDASLIGAAGGAPMKPVSSRPLVVPAVGVEASIEVGQNLFVTGDMGVYRPTVSLAQTIDLHPPNAGRLRIFIPSSALKFDSSNGSGAYYVTGYGRVEGVSEIWSGKPTIGLFLPRDGGAAEVFMLNGNGMKHYPSPGIAVKVNECAFPTQGVFRRELVYSGFSKGSLSILYREFLNDMARPAFSQDLTYDLSAGSEIGFRGARIRIIEANNVGLRYVVLRPFDAAAR